MSNIRYLGCEIKVPKFAKFVTLLMFTMEVQREYSFFNLSAVWGGWLTSRTGYFTPVNDQVPLYKKLGVPQLLSGQEREISSPLGFDPRTA